MAVFPLPQIVAFLIGGLVILFIKRQYRQIRTIEVIILLALYAALVIVISEPVVNLIKQYVG